MSKIKAVVYARVSSDEQSRKDFSIPKIQVPECIKYIKEEGWLFAGSYIDEGIDCNAFIKRTELQRMINGDSDNYDVIVVWSYDRLVGDDENTRGMIYHNLDKKKKQITSVRQKARIVSPDEYDPKGLNVAQQRQITDIGVSFDRKIRRERFMESRTKTVANGRHISEPPYGYKLIRRVHPEDKRRTIGYRTINEEESLILKRIFIERADVKSFRAIAFNLNKDGIRARKGGFWTNARIYQVLKNPYPCGTIIWGKTTDRKYGDEKILTLIPEEKWQYYKVNRELEKYYKPAISKVLFNRVQEVNKINKRLKGKGSYSPNILAGLLKCPVCGRPMVEGSGRQLKKYYLSYYICSSHHNDGVCKNKKRIRAPELKEAVIKEVIKYINDPEEFKEYQKQKKKETIEEIKRESVGYKNKLEKSQLRLRSLNMKFIDGKIKEDYYKELLVGLEDEEEKLKGSIDKINEKLGGFKLKKNNILEIKALGKNFYKMFMELDNAKKKHILHTLIEEIRVNNDKVQIFYKV